MKVWQLKEMLDRFPDDMDIEFMVEDLSSYDIVSPLPPPPITLVKSPYRGTLQFTVIRYKEGIRYEC